MHYGHGLEFGTFITPRSDTPQVPVAFAQLSEQLGFDLVTYQDHPYQPMFLDTWTLLTWVAASTERIRVAANVHNMTLRQPAILARSAASLDLLSGGRVDLGVGSGAFNEAATAMGAPERTPGQGVDALSEAIDVIRGLWDVDDRRPLRIHGQYHRIDGAKRGPAPAHQIPIWVGATKPRMERLIARKGDGWLPSLGYIGIDGLIEGNRVIDAEAERVGRDPREIRRLLNIGGRFGSARSGFLQGTPSDWVEDLLPLVVEHGVGTFILASDDPNDLQRFAGEVMPALRERVDAAVPGGSHGVRVRSRESLSLRRDGIAYDELPDALAASAVEPGDRDYRRLRGGYLRGGAPGLILRPADTDEVVDALAVARRHPGLPLAVRSGGHGISGRSTNDGGIVIDLGRMNGIEVLDENRRLVRVGAGATWGEVARALGGRGWGLSSGDYGGVGVGGLATAGGIGYLARSQGLTIDHLRAVQLVLADGSVVWADHERESDLFWAVRGAGGNVGIATLFDFEVEEVGTVGWARLTQQAGDFAEYLVRWGEFVDGSPRDFSSFLTVVQTGPAGTVVHTSSVVQSDDPDTVLARIRPIAELAPLVEQEVVLAPYSAVLLETAGEPHVATGEPLSHSGFVDAITPEFATAAVRALSTGAIGWFQLRPVGGAVSDVDPDATAYGFRSARYALAAMGSNRLAFDDAWARLRPHLHGLYLSFETDDDPATIAAAFPPATLARLVAIKQRVDPHDLFRHNFDVTKTLPKRAVDAA